MPLRRHRDGAREYMSMAMWLSLVFQTMVSRIYVQGVLEANPVDDLSFIPGTPISIQTGVAYWF